MRIAQVAPLFESVPPKYYGGTERVVSYLTEELVRQGHKVTLFASGDSVTSARLVAPCHQALRLDGRCMDQLVHHVIMLDMVALQASNFDIVHFHLDYLHFPLFKRMVTPHITTLHGRLDLADLTRLYEQFPNMPVVSISDAQRNPLSWINWQGTVYHGLPLDMYTFQGTPEKYLALIGRICPEKGVDKAIEIAKRLGMPIKIAAKVDKVDQVYFNERIKPLLRDPCVEYIGEIGDREKNRFLGNAYALLFPVDWPEPFGLAVIEALACGTPVIAYRRGSVPEILENGVTGFIVEGIDDAMKAVRQIGTLSRKRCRQVFEERFSATRMAQDYLTLYENLLNFRSQPKVA